MVWAKEMDLELLKEIADEGVMHQKPKSKEKGSAWQKVVDNINFLPGYEVSCRSVRDRYNNLAKKHKIRMGKEERSTGGGGSELNECENILEELIQINEESEQKAADESNAKEVLVNEDKAKAIEMRKRAMETMGETGSRTGEGSKNEKRRSASQSFQWLQEAIKAKQLQAEEEKKAREDERREKEEEKKEKKEEQQKREQETSYLFEKIQNNQYAQQQQQQQFSTMQRLMMQLLEQQQKQSDMILELLKRPKN
jgi:hypothetical protein